MSPSGTEASCSINPLAVLCTPSRSARESCVGACIDSWLCSRFSSGLSISFISRLFNGFSCKVTRRGSRKREKSNYRPIHAHGQTIGLTLTPGIPILLTGLYQGLFMNIVRVGVIGLGNMGTHHIKYLSAAEVE